MTPAELEDLSRQPRFPATARDLIRIAGLEGAAALITAWPGQIFQIPKLFREPRAGKKAEHRYSMLAEIVGDQVALDIFRSLRGCVLSIPNCKDALWDRTQEKIRAHFDRLDAQGYSFDEAIFELGIHYNVTGRCLMKVLKRPDAAADTDQLSLF